MATVTMEVPESVLAVLRNNPDEFASEMRLAAAATWYEKGKVSQEVAARIAGLIARTFFSRWREWGEILLGGFCRPGQGIVAWMRLPSINASPLILLSRSEKLVLLHEFAEESLCRTRSPRNLRKRHRRYYGKSYRRFGLDRGCSRTSCSGRNRLLGAWPWRVVGACRCQCQSRHDRHHRRPWRPKMCREPWHSGPWHLGNRLDCKTSRCDRAARPCLGRPDCLGIVSPSTRSGRGAECVVASDQRNSWANLLPTPLRCSCWPRSAGMRRRSTGPGRGPWKRGGRFTWKAPASISSKLTITTPRWGRD